MTKEEEKAHWEHCVKTKKNPNPNPPGQLFSLGSVEEIRAAGSEAFKRIKKVFALKKSEE